MGDHNRFIKIVLVLQRLQMEKLFLCYTLLVLKIWMMPNQVHGFHPLLILLLIPSITVLMVHQLRSVGIKPEGTMKRCSDQKYGSKRKNDSRTNLTNFVLQDILPVMI